MAEKRFIVKCVVSAKDAREISGQHKQKNFDGFYMKKPVAPHFFGKLTTPCIGLCSTVYGDEVCRGCKRFAAEVDQWNAWQVDQQSTVWQRLQAILTPIMQSYLFVVDQQSLNDKLKQHGIRFYAQLNPYCRAYHLLRLGAANINDLTKYGLKLHNASDGQDLPGLFNQIDQQYLQQSQAALAQAALSAADTATSRNFKSLEQFLKA